MASNVLNYVLQWYLTGDQKKKFAVISEIFILMPN